MMKLARPDVRHPRIVLAGCPRAVEGDGDDADLVAALRKRGLHARWLSWDDPQTHRADLVILRATWDYVDRLEEFLSWTTSLPQLLNAPQVVAWNADKRYLRDLSRAGVPVLSSQFFAPGDTVRLPAGDVVVQPTAGAGSEGAHRFTDPAAAREHAVALQTDGRTVLVQPYLARAEAGETALVFLGGRQSHAFTTGPIRPALADPDFALWDVGYAALAAAADHLGIAASEFLYARADVIGGPDDCLLVDLALVEPALGWRLLDAEQRTRQQREFALSVESALDRLDLGPLSHRRP
jgi:hypothetical protein